MYSVVDREQYAVGDGHVNLANGCGCGSQSGGVQVISFHKPDPGFLFDMTPSADPSLLIGVDVYA